MARLVNAHLACDDCGSSDALAEYEKNTYCFSCHVSRQKSTEKSFFPKLEDLDDKSNTSLRMPRGSSRRLSPAAMNWLLSHQIEKRLREKYDIKYVYESEAAGIPLRNRVILPSYKLSGELAFYQARALGQGDNPKYYTIGSKEHLFWSKSPDTLFTNSIVLVEDILSAIRVGEVVQAVSLIGTSLKQRKLLRLSQDYGIIIVWMDGDSEGQKAAKKLVKQASLLTSNVINIKTKQDPKCLFESEIIQQLAPYID